MRLLILEGHDDHLISLTDDLISDVICQRDSDLALIEFRPIKSHIKIGFYMQQLMSRKPITLITPSNSTKLS